MADTFVGRLMHRLHSADAKLETIKEKAAETMGRALTLAEVSVANGGLSYANGRYGNTAGATGVDSHISYFNVPLDLAVGAGLGGLGLLNLFGKYSEHAFNLGIGGVQCFVGRNALSMGLAAAAAPATTSGYVPAFSAGAYSPYGHAYGHAHAQARG